MEAHLGQCVGKGIVEPAVVPAMVDWIKSHSGHIAAQGQLGTRMQTLHCMWVARSLRDVVVTLGANFCEMEVGHTSERHGSVEQNY